MRIREDEYTELLYEISYLRKKNEGLRQAVEELLSAYLAAMGLDYISDLPCEDLRNWLEGVEKLLEQ